MKHLYRLFLSSLVVLMLAGCGTMMKNVMKDCDRGQRFDVYVSCVKSTYSTKGRRPNSTEVRAFYANLDMISEAYKDGKISDAQAKSMAWDSYMRNIQASNDRGDVTAMYMMNALQQQQQLQMQNQRQYQTQCYQNGSYTNCRTY